MAERSVLQYLIVEKLGAGGMGEVYKARDTRLNRYVAMKVLPASMAADPERRRRFLQEAQAASALNHPNIITIYDIVQDGDTQYMVVEYVDGKTLLELIPKDGLRVPQAIQYATQMAEALSAAHAAGIIHRDLKPANVMVTGTGLVKLLDFGLAKILEPQGSADSGAHSGNTATVMEAPLTVEGTIMGTVDYMSPEQAEGRKLDARSDIFSFGAVLYEMLTGRSAFRGESTVATLTAILRDEVRPIAELTPDVPSELERIAGGCLKKRVDERFQSMKEVQGALATLRRQSESGALYNRVSQVGTAAAVRMGSVTTGAAVAQSGSKITGMIVAAALAIVAAGGGYWWMNRPRPAAPVAEQAAAAAQTVPAAPVAVPPAPDAGMTNDSIVEMVAAKVAPTVIASQIRTSKTNFDLSAGEVIRLSQAGVPANVIELMRNPRAAQIPASSGDAPKRAATAAAPVALGDGLPVRLTLTADVPADAAEGDELHFTVAEDVTVEGTVVIAKGAAAAGAVVDGAKKKILALGGKMTMRLDTVEAVDGQKVPIRATPGKRKGDEAPKRPVNTGAKKAKELAAAAGTEYVGYVNGPKAVSVKK